jgi:hypothetical protein
MDYRDLLKRYMRRVRDCEGETFRPDYPGDDTATGGSQTVSFTDAEFAELAAIEQEGHEDEQREIDARTEAREREEYARLKAKFG